MAWTKDELKNAPEFQYFKAPARAAASGSDAGRPADRARRPRRRVSERSSLRNGTRRVVQGGGPDGFGHRAATFVRQRDDGHAAHRE